MTTPLPRTPGDQREDHAQAAATAVAAIYAQAELVIIAAIATLARKVATGAMLPAIAARTLRATVNATLSAAAPRIRAELDTAMQGASLQATAMVTSTAAQPAPLPVAPTAVPQPTLAVAKIAAPAPAQWTEPLAALLDQAGDTAAQAAEDSLTAVTAAAAKVAGEAPERAAVTTASRVAIPPPENPYGAALGKAFGQFGGFPGQSLSYRRMQAAQAMLDELGDKGITGFTDKRGRNWDLASYTEMATRTAVSNAWDDMQWQMATRSGLDLVKVGTHSTEGSCKLCLPWLGKTLSLTGATSGYKTVEEAKAEGWRHPNCRCFATVIGGGYMADVTNPVDIDNAAKAYKASQRQRAHERAVRRAGRAMQAAITPQAKTRARRDLASARAASAAHRQRHGVVMLKVGVRRRERPFGPRLPLAERSVVQVDGPHIPVDRDTLPDVGVMPLGEDRVPGHLGSRGQVPGDDRMRQVHEAEAEQVTLAFTLGHPRRQAAGDAVRPHRLRQRRRHRVQPVRRHMHPPRIRFARRSEAVLVLAAERDVPLGDHRVTFELPEHRHVVVAGHADPRQPVDDVGASRRDVKRERPHPLHALTLPREGGSTCSS